MIIDRKSADALKKELAGRKKIAILSHTNPDGDAIGSGLALKWILEIQGHEARFIVPNNYPYFLEWIKGIEEVCIYKSSPEECEKFVGEADTIFFVDFNQAGRIEGLSKAVESNKKAVRILIDHHLDPPADFNIAISETKASSTAYLIYVIAECLGMAGKITRQIAEALYVGFSTDTGNFAFGNLTPHLFRCLAELVEKGVDIPAMNSLIYNNYSFNRTKLMGYAVNRKMKVIGGYDAAYISLNRKELNKYEYQPGDTEGFVNIPLTIKGMKMSALFTEVKEGVKVSLRSKGDIDVNTIARKYFNGGGHKNAAGGNLQGSITEAIALYRKMIKTEFKER